MVNEKDRVRDNIVVVLKDAKTGRVKQVVKTMIDPLDPEQKRLINHNIVTNTGDKYYAQRGAAETPSLTITSMTVSATIKAATKNATFDDLVTAAGVSGIPTGGTQTVDGTYPQTADGDTDNTGADSDVVTWLRTYTTTQGNTNVKAIVLHQTGAGTFVASGNTNDLLNAATLAVSVSKTSTDTLKVFVNHTFTGV